MRKSWVLRRWRVVFSKYAVVLVLVGVLVSCRDNSFDHSPASTGEEAPNEVLAPAEIYRVERVIDGDSVILVGGAEVRYIGVNCPALDEPMGLKAMALNKKLVEGKEVVLEFEDKQTDRFGRLLAYIFVFEGEDKKRKFVNEELVREGLAVVTLYRGWDSYGPKLIAAQRDAINQHKGIWAVPVVSTEEYYIGSVNSYRFHRPDCKFGRKIPRKNRTCYETRIAAFKDGRSPCRECRP